MLFRSQGVLTVLPHLDVHGAEQLGPAWVAFGQAELVGLGLGELGVQDEVAGVGCELE